MAAPETTGAQRGRLVREPGNGALELFPLDLSPPPAAEALLARLLRRLFSRHWSEISFGSLIQGAVFELRPPHAPERIGMLDGYLTVDFGAWHFHICIGQHRGSPDKPVAADLARHRRTGRAELYRRLDDAGYPVSWGLRLFNGHDEQQLTVFLPNPLLNDAGKPQSPPDWSRLALWDALRREYLGLEPEALDRQAERFAHD